MYKVFKQIQIVLFLLSFLACKTNNPIVLEQDTYNLEDFEMAEFELITPDLDPLKFAPTHMYINVEIQG